jgi:tRNA1Val (adenine37-N6)-methyltransferase
MPNNYFEFKQFIVHQDKCAMKVCTDACLFGAYVADKFQKTNARFRVLDIGAGTGLLSLMIAQKNLSAEIDAVEIDKPAAEQAKENFRHSPWKDRMHIHHQRIQDFGINTYDLIVSNPPFYENDLKSENVKRNLALHGSALGLDDLLDVVQKHISTQGKFAVLLPYHRSANFINHAQLKDFYLLDEVSVKQTPKHPYFRSMLLFGRMKVPVKHSDLCIKEANDQYSTEFRELLKDYYLAL